MCLKSLKFLSSLFTTIKDVMWLQLASTLSSYFISSIEDDYKNIVMRFYYFRTITTWNHHKKYKYSLYRAKKGMSRDKQFIISFCSILFIVQTSLRQKPQICPASFVHTQEKGIKSFLFEVFVINILLHFFNIR